MMGGYALYHFVRNLTLDSLTFVTGAGALVIGLNLAVARVDRWIKDASDDFQLFIGRLGKALAVLFYMVAGAWLHQRWTEEPRILELAVGVGVFVLLSVCKSKPGETLR